MKIKSNFYILLVSTLLSNNLEVIWEPFQLYEDGSYSSINIYMRDLQKSNNDFKYAYVLDNNDPQCHLVCFQLNPSYAKNDDKWMVFNYNLNESEKFNLDVVFDFNSQIHSDLLSIDELKRYNLSNIVDESDLLFQKIDLLLSEKKYFESMNLLNEIISKDLTSENIVKAKYILSELYINDFNDYKSGIDLLNQIIKDFSNMSYAKKALFTKGYIYANYLDNYSKAAKVYELFIDTYPNDDLVPSVKYELDILNSVLNSLN